MGPPLPSPAVGRETTMYFWTLPGPEGAVLGAAVVAVETSLTMGCTLGTVVVTGEVVVEPEPGAEVLRDKTCWVDEALEDDDITINLVGGGEGWGGAAARADTSVWTGSAMEPGTFSKPGVRGPGWGACERVSVGRGCVMVRVVLLTC